MRTTAIQQQEHIHYLRVFFEGLPKKHETKAIHFVKQDLHSEFFLSFQSGQKRKTIENDEGYY